MEPSQPGSHLPIVAAFDPRSAAREPVDFAVAASAFTGAPLVVVAVRHGFPSVRWSTTESGDGDANGHGAIEELRQDLERRRVAADVRVMEARTAAGGLEHAIAELEPALIVVGSTGRGAAGKALIGTTAERVLHVSHRPVAVVPTGYERPSEGVRTVGAAYAPTAEGREALHAAAALARIAGAHLRAITVLEPKGVDDQKTSMLSGQHREVDATEELRARQRLDTEAELRAAAGGGGAEIDVLTQDPAEGLVAASRHVDVLVMGSRAHGPKRGVLLGSVSRRVMERASCPVLVIPRGSEAATEALIAEAEAHAAG
jgi:nucleotide-binding universal stress UspA family protein